MSDLLIERMRKAARELDGKALEARDYAPKTYLEYSDLRELLEKGAERIEELKHELDCLHANYPQSRRAGGGLFA